MPARLSGGRCGGKKKVIHGRSMEERSTEELASLSHLPAKPFTLQLQCKLPIQSIYLASFLIAPSDWERPCSTLEKAALAAVAPSIMARVETVSEERADFPLDLPELLSHRVAIVPPAVQAHIRLHTHLTKTCTLTRHHAQTKQNSKQ